MMGLWILLLASCAYHQPVTSIDVRPPNFWETRPVPCPYEEVRDFRVEAWTYDTAVKPMSSFVVMGNAEAIIDFEVSNQWVKVNSKDCGVVYQCDGSFNGLLWIAEGMAVDWLCPEGQPKPGGWTQ